MAIAQSIKRMLAYSTIAMPDFCSGADPGTPEAYGAALFYAVTNVVFGRLRYDVVLSRGTQEADQIDSFAGLGKRNPLLALVTLILMFSMAGVPPFLFLGQMERTA